MRVSDFQVLESISLNFTRFVFIRFAQGVVSTAPESPIIFNSGVRYYLRYRGAKIWGFYKLKLTDFSIKPASPGGPTKVQTFRVWSSDCTYSTNVCSLVVAGIGS